MYGPQRRMSTGGESQKFLALAEVAVKPDVHFSGARTKKSRSQDNPGGKTLVSILVIVSTIPADGFRP